MFTPREPGGVVVGEVPEMLNLSVRTEAFATHSRQEQAVGNDGPVQDGFCPNNHPMRIVPIGPRVILQEMQIVGLPLAAQAARSPMQRHQ